MRDDTGEDHSSFDDPPSSFRHPPLLPGQKPRPQHNLHRLYSTFVPSTAPPSSRRAGGRRRDDVPHGRRAAAATRGEERGSQMEEKE